MAVWRRFGSSNNDLGWRDGSSSSDTSGDLFHSSFCFFFFFFFGAIGAVRCLGCVCVKILGLWKLLGTIPKQKDRPWSDNVQSNMKN
uniref:Transmembrane protein n=1 Tax=Romanomermis culicivorax TaxID=13658 RepID=A0A915IJQ0_ROMCU